MESMVSFADKKAELEARIKALEEEKATLIEEISKLSLIHI